MSTLENAISIAAAAHAGQQEKNGRPYVLHPLRVMMSVVGAGCDAQIVAVLHDVVEDTPTTLDDLRAAGFSARVIDAIAILTHDKATDSFTYVRAAATDALAREVKRADLHDNMDLSRIPDVQEKDLMRIQRYRLGQMVTTVESRSSCDLERRVWESYFIFASHTESGPLATQRCSGSVEERTAQREITALGFGRPSQPCEPCVC